MGMDAIEFVMDIEKAFGIEVSDKIAADLWTVGAWHEYLVKQVPSMDPKAIWEKELDVLCKLMGIRRRRPSENQAE